MDFESAMGLSQQAVKRAVDEARSSRALVSVPKGALATTKRPAAEPDGATLAELSRPPVGFGASRGRGGWKVAVRAWTAADLESSAARWVLSEAGNEVDVQITGVIRAHAAPRARPAAKAAALGTNYTGVCRPLRPGHSIAHHLVSAGTLGAWVEPVKSNVPLLMLSNNHVLANVDRATRGDTICQPGPGDDPNGIGGPVGKLHRFVRLRAQGNLVDAAVASVARKYSPDDFAIPQIGRVQGWWTSRTKAKDLGQRRVQKTGRTTGHRWGRISAAVLNDLAIDYGEDGGPSSILRFDGVLEVGNLDAGQPFGLRGDSGSLVLDAEKYAVGLLFACGEHTTYLNPIGPVLDKLGVALIK